MKYAPVAQLDRVTDYESVGRGFESLPAYHFCVPGNPLWVPGVFFFIRLPNILRLCLVCLGRDRRSRTCHRHVRYSPTSGAPFLRPRESVMGSRGFLLYPPAKHPAALPCLFGKGQAKPDMPPAIPAQIKKIKPRNNRFRVSNALPGDPPGDRTPDTLLKRQVLYRLS